MPVTPRHHIRWDCRRHAAEMVRASPQKPSASSDGLFTGVHSRPNPTRVEPRSFRRFPAVSNQTYSSVKEPSWGYLGILPRLVREYPRYPMDTIGPIVPPVNSGYLGSSTSYPCGGHQAVRHTVALMPFRVEYQLFVDLGMNSDTPTSRRVSRLRGCPKIFRETGYGKLRDSLRQGGDFMITVEASDAAVGMSRQGVVDLLLDPRPAAGGFETVPE